MQWKKAGRPSVKSEVEEKPEWLEQDWTKEEQSIIAATEYASMGILAVMVVRQWVRDGKPNSDYEGVKPWIQIIKDSLSYRDQKAMLPGIGKANDE